MKKGRHFKKGSNVKIGTTIKSKVKYVSLVSAILLGGVLLAGVQGTQASETDGKWVPRSIDQIKKDVEGKKEYTIVWGDTLSGISQATNLTMEKLASLNGIGDYNLIYAGNKMIFDGDVVTVQDANGVVQTQQQIQPSDKVIPTQPAGESVPQATQDSTAQSQSQAPVADNGTQAQTPAPSAPVDNGTQGGAVDNGNQGGAVDNGNSGGQVTPTPTPTPTPNPEPTPTPEPTIRYTVWYTAYDGDDQSLNITRGSHLFATEAEATSFIDNYADQALMQGIAGSYGVMSWEG
ncbi:LysM peptidoglycan-binding domain-containing protein [Enterococcus sp. AZ007]|uniref:LysM peptidoglycan-binding domain-containing protein n=1 Tax=Enterococcus sp. AZ007 TaxID=2774839 RepID=UPI003F1FA5FC